jgi:hypothetical protein
MWPCVGVPSRGRGGGWGRKWAQPGSCSGSRVWSWSGHRLLAAQVSPSHPQHDAHFLKLNECSIAVRDGAGALSRALSTTCRAHLPEHCGLQVARAFNASIGLLWCRIDNSACLSHRVSLWLRSGWPCQVRPKGMHAVTTIAMRLIEEHHDRPPGLVTLVYCLLVLCLCSKYWHHCTAAQAYLPSTPCLPPGPVLVVVAFPDSEQERTRGRSM